MFPRVSIVILNWNNAPDTLECLASLERLDYPDYHIVVVDNGSEDGSPEKIRAHYTEVDLLALGQNLGYGAGNNTGIRYALDHGADYVLLLNNDTTVHPSIITELLSVGELQPNVGMLGPTVYSMASPSTLFAAGSFVDWFGGTIRHRGMSQPADRYVNSYHPMPVDFIVGCGLLVSRRCIEIIGLLDPLYYLNFEDVEWGIRAWRRGFQVYYVPRAVMWHKVNASLGEASPANTYYMTRNALLFFWRNASMPIRPLAVSRILLRTSRTIAAWTFKTAYRNDWFRRKRDANLLAIRDFFLGRFGRMGTDVAQVCYGV